MGHARAFVLAFIAVAVAIALALCSHQTAQAQQRSPPSGDLFLCGDDKMRDKIKQLMTDALDEALRSHIEHTFSVWMKDDREQPGRAARGVNQGVAAYIRSRRSVDQWTLPSC